MPSFTPPTVNTVPRFLPETVGTAKALFKFYAPSAVYVQVFLLSDNSYVQNYATDENSNTNIPYPWNPNDPGGPFVTGTYIDYTTSPPRQAHLYTSHDIWITKLYDRPMKITADEATALRAAGYGGVVGNSLVED